MGGEKERLSGFKPRAAKWATLYMGEMAFLYGRATGEVFQRSGPKEFSAGETRQCRLQESGYLLPRPETPEKFRHLFPKTNPGISFLL